MAPVILVSIRVRVENDKRKYKDDKYVWKQLMHLFLSLSLSLSIYIYIYIKLAEKNIIQIGEIYIYYEVKSTLTFRFQ